MFSHECLCSRGGGREGALVPGPFPVSVWPQVLSWRGGGGKVRVGRSLVTGPVQSPAGWGGTLSPSTDRTQGYSLLKDTRASDVFLVLHYFIEIIR